MSVIIDWNVYTKMYAYAKAASTEVIGIGYQKVLPETGSVYVYDIALVPQESTGADAEIKDYGAVVDQLTDEQFAEHNTIWHSHLGKVFVSKQDEEYIEKFMKNADWLLSLIINAEDGSLLARVDTKKPVRMHSELEVRFLLDESIDKEIKEKVQRPVEVVNVSTTGLRLRGPARTQPNNSNHRGGVRRFFSGPLGS